jgi:hypothetical protein
LNLITAIKSGRPIRRKDRTVWNNSTTSYFIDPTQNQWIDPKFYLETIGVCRDDLLSDQWEIREPTVTITRTQFDAAWAEMLEYERGMQDGHTQLYIAVRGPELLKRVLARRLGLEGDE